MIKSKKGKVSLKGRLTEFGADLALATKVVLNAAQDNGMSREEAICFVRESVELGLKTDDEIREEAKKRVTKMMSDILSTMNEEGEESNE